MNVLVYLILLAVLGGATGKIEKGLEERLRESLAAKKVEVKVTRAHRAPFSTTVDELSINLEDFQLKDGPAPSEGIIFSPGKDVQAGKISSIKVGAHRFSAQGLAVKELQVTICELRYNMKKALLRRKLEIIGVKSCQGQLLLEESALNRFAAPKVKELDNFRLRLTAGRVEISGNYKNKLNVPVPVTLTARLQPQGGQVYLVEPRLKLSVMPVPGFVAQRVADQVNPVVDLNSDPALPCIISIAQLRAEPGALHATADIVLRPGGTAQPADKAH